MQERLANSFLLFCLSLPIATLSASCLLLNRHSFFEMLSFDVKYVAIPGGTLNSNGLFVLVLNGRNCIL
jgi:hypothetical protein